MPHSRKPDPKYSELVGRQARDQLLIVLVAMLAIVTGVGAVGFSRVQHAYEIAARV